MTQKLTAYQKYLEQKKLQPETIETYLWHVHQFLQWLDNKKLDTSNLKLYYIILYNNLIKIKSDFKINIYRHLYSLYFQNKFQNIFRNIFSKN